MTDYIGIDYGSIGGSNRNPKTGIHYGVISQHSLNPDILNDVILNGADFGDATCPKCGRDAVEISVLNAPIENWERARYESEDYGCTNCQFVFGSESAFSDEMIGWAHEEDGYKLTDCLTNDVFVIESPFYTYAQFCSPCVPGAGNLDTPLSIDTGAPKAYCLNHDWFDSGKAPYRVFRVSDHSEVLPESEVSQ